jgi:cytochrome c biogenesis protein CcdA
MHAESPAYAATASTMPPRAHRIPAERPAREAAGRSRSAQRIVAGVLTGAVFLGATAGILIAVISNHSLAAALAVGGVLAAATLWGLIRHVTAEGKRLASIEAQIPYE